MHELQLCENSADNDQGQPPWPVSSDCHIMKQSMLTFLWWCLNITLKCLCFFPGILQKLLWLAVGWGWMGHSCPAFLLLALPSLHPHSHLQHKQAGGCSTFLFAGLKPGSLKPGFKDHRAPPSPHPSNTICGTCWNLSYAACNRLLSCLVSIFNSLFFSFFMCYFLPPKYTKMVMSTLCAFNVSLSIQHE